MTVVTFIGGRMVHGAHTVHPDMKGHTGDSHRDWQFHLDMEQYC